LCGLTCKINRGQTLLDCKSKLLGREQATKIMAPLYGSSSSGNLFMAPPILIKLAARYHNINKGSSIAPNKTHQANGCGTVGPNSKNPPKIKLKSL
jgi:hypothetical protein